MKILGAILGLCVLGSIAVLVQMQSWFSSPIDSFDSEQVYVVEEGASLNRVAAELAELGIIARPRVFSIRGRLSGQAEQIKAGEYLLAPGLSPAGLLEQLVAGRVKMYPV